MPGYSRNYSTFSLYLGAGTSTLPGGAVQGDVLYFDGTAWALLAPGTAGQFLETQGVGANPTWASVSGVLPAGVQGDLLYHNGTTWVVLAPGGADDVLTSGGAGANPAWATMGGDVLRPIDANVVVAITGNDGVVEVGSTAARFVWAAGALTPGFGQTVAAAGAGADRIERTQAAAAGAGGDFVVPLGLSTAGNPRFVLGNETVAGGAYDEAIAIDVNSTGNQAITLLDTSGGLTVEWSADAAAGGAGFTFNAQNGASGAGSFTFNAGDVTGLIAGGGGSFFFNPGVGVEANGNFTINTPAGALAFQYQGTENVIHAAVDIRGDSANVRALSTGYVAVPIGGNVDVTLDGDQAACSFIKLTGTLTGPVSVIAPLTAGAQIEVWNASSGDTMTFIGATGTGIVVATDRVARLGCDGTNWVRLSADSVLTP